MPEPKATSCRIWSSPVSSLYLLAAPSTPEVVRNEIIARAESGEKITHKEVQKTIAKAHSARKPRGEAKEKVPIKSLRDRSRSSPREYELKIVHEPTRVLDPREVMAPAQSAPQPTEQAEGTVEANDLIRPLREFVADFSRQLSEWREQGSFSQKDRDELVQALHQMANSLTLLA